jgi:hypothetical protein
LKTLKYAEWGTATILTIVVLALLFARAKHAGALWRDECAVIQLATMPTVSDLLRNFQRESFPALFPLTVRVYATLFGTSDTALRAFGLTIGVMFMIVVWLNARILSNGPPLIALALIGLNISFLTWGTSLRAYGIGSVLILLAFGLITKMQLDPDKSWVLPALFASIASVQFLLYNSVLLFAIGLAAITVSLARRNHQSALAIVGIGAACVLAVLPYVGPFRFERKSTIVLTGPVTLAWFWDQLLSTFGDPVPLMAGIWIGIFVVVTIGALIRLYLIRSTKPEPEWDLLLFGLVSLTLSVVFYFAFLSVLSYSTREWYYLALLSIIAGAIDLLAAQLARIQWVRVARVVFAITALVAMPFAIWPKLIARQTNADLVARDLQRTAQLHDLIVLNPWYLGISFSWYYRGTTPWVSLPLMNDHNLHRFDLLKAKMMSPDPIDDLLDLIGTTLRSGNRVWFVGGVKMLPPDRAAIKLQPAPDPEFEWSCDAYAETWSQQVGIFIRSHALEAGYLPVQSIGPVCELENVAVFVAQGWLE